MSTNWESVFVSGYSGFDLSHLLAEWANDAEMHDNEDGEPCHCIFCQVFVPMAISAEKKIDKIIKLLPNDPDSALDDRIRHIEKHGDPGLLTPDDVCGIMEKMYIEQCGAIWDAVNPPNNANQRDGRTVGN